MSRTEAIAQIQSSLSGLPDEQLRALADIARSFGEPRVFPGLTDADRAALDEAVDSLDRGEGIHLDEVDIQLEAKLRAAGA